VTLIAVSPDSKFRSRREQESKLRIISSPRALHDGFVLNRLTSGGGWGPLDIYKRIRVGMSRNYDIIQTFDHFANISIPFNYLRKRCKAKFVSDWCDIYHLPGGFADSFGYRLDGIYRKVNFLFRKYLKTMEISIRKNADAVIVISHFLKDFAIDCGIDASKIEVIQGGVDTEKIIPMSKLESRKRIGLPADSKIVVFLGRSQFDLDILIRSFAQIRKQFPNSYLIIVGSSLYRWPREPAANLGIIDGYIEVGRCPDEMLPIYLCCADIFALPMKDNLVNQTRWPNKIGEYMACGRPVVISDVGEVAEVVREHGIGLVARPNIDSFSENMRILLANEELASEMGARARELACEKYSWALMAARLESIYFQLLK